MWPKTWRRRDVAEAERQEPNKCRVGDDPEFWTRVVRPMISNKRGLAPVMGVDHRGNIIKRWILAKDYRPILV